MEPSEITLIIVFIMAVVGFVFGVVFGYTLRPKQGSGNNIKELKRKAGAVEIAAIIRYPATGNLVIEADNNLVSQLAEIDPEKAKEIERLLQELLLRGEKEAGENTRVIAQRSDSVNQQEAPPASHPVITIPFDSKPSTPGKEKNQTGSLKEKAGTDPSIVMQIDRVLQQDLAAADQINRGIRLSEDAENGVIVWIGLDHYNGIDAVPDPEVKRLIRKAVAEWEGSEKT